jgi:uncharacterized protein YukJ
MSLNKNMKDYQDHWLGMPDFDQKKLRPYAQIIIRVDNEDDLNELSKRLGQKLTKKTKSAWFPFRSHWGLEKKVWVTDNDEK